MTPEHLPTEHYDQLLLKKVHYIKNKMSHLCLQEVIQKMDIFASPVSHYRMRAEFRLWHDGERVYHIIFDQKTGNRIRVDQFPAASRLINQVMPLIIDGINADPILRYKVFQVDYLSTLSGQILVSLLYHRPLGHEWISAAETLRDNIRKKGVDFQFVGRARKTKICLYQDYVEEHLMVAGTNILFRQIENTFTQPNACVNLHMLEWAIDATKGSSGDLLELYCGNGNFSLALARNFRRVLATEIAKSSVAAAQYNILANKIDNVQIVRLSANEFISAIKRVRHFNRLSHIDLSSYQCETIFVDPPRAGLDTETLTLLKQYPRVLYMSCNPTTLSQNLEHLSATHEVMRLALFDQFPYTHHVETGVLLARRR